MIFFFVSGFKSSFQRDPHMKCVHVNCWEGDNLHKRGQITKRTIQARHLFSNHAGRNCKFVKLESKQNILSRYFQTNISHLRNLRSFQIILLCAAPAWNCFCFIASKFTGSVSAVSVSSAVSSAPKNVPSEVFLLYFYDWIHVQWKFFLETSCRCSKPIAMICSLCWNAGLPFVGTLFSHASELLNKLLWLSCQSNPEKNRLTSFVFHRRLSEE